VLVERLRPPILVEVNFSEYSGGLAMVPDQRSLRIVTGNDKKRMDDTESRNDKHVAYEGSRPSQHALHAQCSRFRDFSIISGHADGFVSLPFLSFWPCFILFGLPRIQHPQTFSIGISILIVASLAISIVGSAICSRHYFCAIETF
jgi:hypothetical protein